MRRFSRMLTMSVKRPVRPLERTITSATTTGQRRATIHAECGHATCALAGSPQTRHVSAAQKGCTVRVTICRGYGTRYEPYATRQIGGTTASTSTGTVDASLVWGSSGQALGQRPRATEPPPCFRPGSASVLGHRTDRDESGEPLLWCSAVRISCAAGTKAWALSLADSGHHLRVNCGRTMLQAGRPLGRRAAPRAGPFHGLWGQTHTETRGCTATPAHVSSPLRL